MKQIFEKNRIWVAGKNQNDPHFFERLSKGQTPEYLFIGCSDSRVPANEITGTDFGETFVHRNIANLIVHTDISLLSTLQYAVEMLKVRHIIVCGHYGCGGIIASLDNKDLGLIDNWLRNIRDIARIHKGELENLKGVELERKMVELNVIEGVYRLSTTSIVQSAWHRGIHLEIHGLVYDMHDGLLKDLGVSLGE